MKTASVVINTYNRAAYLPNAIRSIAAQSHPRVELIVVNGPSTDASAEVLDQLLERGYRFKVLDCPSRNLSESRNIGIGAAAGDVVLFIDDDAVAHRDWIARLMPRYEDPGVGAAGGFTIDHTGVAFQCRYTVCDRRGNARYFDTIDPQSLLDSQGGFHFPSLLGTNCSFLRSELEAIGGFDEVFAYMLDETDVCARIYDRGRRIVTVPEALVFHKYAPSHTRSPERIPTSLQAPARSKVYYTLKHDRQPDQPMVALAEVDRYRKDIEFANRWYLDHKKITTPHYLKLNRELGAGIEEGLALGRDPAVRARISRHVAARHVLGERFDDIRAGRPRPGAPLRIYFVSQGYPPHDTAGIARWTHECARSLVDLGHEVHVVTRSLQAASHVDYIDGVWVHFVDDVFDDQQVYVAPVRVPDSVARRGIAVLKEVKRARRIWGCDVVSAPIWDVEGLFCAAYLDVPVVTSLHTTYKLAAPFKPEWATNHGYRRKHVNRVIDAERWLFATSRHILANSNEVVREIEAGYGIDLRGDPGRMAVVPHGLGEPLAPAEPDRLRAEGASAGSPLRLLFVGRIEPRKGPDQLLEAILQLPRATPALEVTLVGQAPGGDDPYAARVRSLAEKVERSGRATVRFAGYVEDAALERHYAAADVFVAPSRFESFGLILVEAMRHGKPVVACDIGGMREVVEDGVEGYLVPVDAPAALAARLAQLARDGTLRARLGAAARASYERRFTARVMGEALEAFFTRVVETERESA